MKKHFLPKKTKTLALFFGILISPVLQAQSPIASKANDITFPIVLEAENAELHGDLKVKSVDGFSNNAYIGDFNDGSGAYLRLLDVEVPAEGTYQLDIYYVSMQLRSMFIKVGSYVQSVVQIKTETKDWNLPPTEVLSSNIYLNKGKNTIKIGCYNGSGPNIDKFEILKTTEVIEKPLEEKAAFNYDLTDDADIIPTVENATLPNMTDNDESTVYSVPGVTATEVIVDCKSAVLLSGYLLSAGSGSTQNVSNWMMEYSKDGAEWFVITPDVTNDLVGATLFTLNRDPSTAQSFAAQYYRLTAYGDADLQIGEFQLFGCPYLENVDGKSFPVDMTDGTDIEVQTFGEPTGTFSETFDERYYNLFNRDLSKKYYQGETNQFYVQYEPTNPQKLDYYTLTSCQDYPDRDPKAWTLEGFSNGLWETINEPTNFKFPCRYATMKFKVVSEKEYAGFKLTMTQNNGSSAFQLLKWQMFGTTGGSGLRNQLMDGLFLNSYNKEIIIKNSNSEKLIYQVFNIAGKIVDEGQMNAEKHITVQSGIYMVKLSSVNKNSVTKVLVN